MAKKIKPFTQNILAKAKNEKETGYNIKPCSDNEKFFIESPKGGCVFVGYFLACCDELQSITNQLKL